MELPEHYWERLCAVSNGHGETVTHWCIHCGAVMVEDVTVKNFGERTTATVRYWKAPNWSHQWRGDAPPCPRKL